MTSALAPYPTPLLSDEVTVGPRIRRQGRDIHLVRDARSDGFFQVSPREAFVLRRLDGTRTFGELERDYADRFGRRLDDAAWGQLLRLLHQRRILVPDGEDPRDSLERFGALREQNAAARAPRRTWWSLRVPLVDPGPVIGWLLTHRSWLLSRRLVVVSVAAVLVMLGVLGWQLPRVWDDYVAAWRGSPLAVVAAVAVVVVSLVVHELAHAVTCVAFGGRCREMGLSWRLPLVTVYTKVDDVYLVPRRWQRTTIALSGVLAGLVVLLPVFVVWLVVPDGHPVAAACLMTLVLGSLAALVNLVPLLALDGQKALSHALGVWDVAEEARHYWVSRLRRRAAGPTPDQGWAVPAYGVLAALLLTVVTGWAVWLGATVLTGLVGELWAAAALAATALAMALAWWTFARGAAR